MEKGLIEFTPIVYGKGTKHEFTRYKWNEFQLTDEGRELAEKYRQEIKEYIEEWSPFIVDDKGEPMPTPIERMWKEKYEKEKEKREVESAMSLAYDEFQRNRQK